MLGKEWAYTRQSIYKLIMLSNIIASILAGLIFGLFNYKVSQILLISLVWALISICYLLVFQRKEFKTFNKLVSHQQLIRGYKTSFNSNVAYFLYRASSDFLIAALVAGVVLFIKNLF